MGSFPFFRFPYNNYYYNYYRPYHSLSKEDTSHSPYKNSTSCDINDNNDKHENIEVESQHESKHNDSNVKKNTRYNSIGPISFTNPLFADMDEPVFEIMGIKLYLDDIIILGLLFFLYKEEVKDETLFLSLILLLIS